MSLKSKRDILTSYLPIALIIILSPLLSTIFGAVGEVPSYQVFPEKGVGPIFNALLWLSATALFGGILIFLMKRSSRFLKYLLMVIGVYTIFTINWLYLDILFTLYLPLDPGSSLIPSIVISVLSLIILVKGRPIPLYSGIILFTMVGLGVILNASLEDMSKIAILIAYSIFDIYSVHRGALKDLFQNRRDALDIFSPLMIRAGVLAIGVGDAIFYSLLLSFALEGGMPLFLLSSLLLSIGHSINLLLLQYRKVIPALPFPILLTLTAIVISKFL